MIAVKSFVIREWVRVFFAIAKVIIVPWDNFV